MLLFLLQLMNLVVFLRHLHLHFIELIYVSFSWWEMQMLCFRPDMNVLKPITMSLRLSRMKTWCASCITRWRRWRIWGMKLDVSFLAEMIQGPFAMWHGRMFLKSTTGFWEQHLSKWRCWGGVSKVYLYIHVYIHTVFSCQVALRNIAVEIFGSLAVHMQWYILEEFLDRAKSTNYDYMTPYHGTPSNCGWGGQCNQSKSTNATTFGSMNGLVLPSMRQNRNNFLGLVSLKVPRRFVRWSFVYKSNCASRAKPDPWCAGLTFNMFADGPG